MSSSEWYSVQVIACRGAILVICHLSGAAGIFEARFVLFFSSKSCHLFLLNQLLDVLDVQAMLDVPLFLHIACYGNRTFPDGQLYENDQTSSVKSSSLFSCGTMMSTAPPTRTLQKRVNNFISYCNVFEGLNHPYQDSNNNKKIYRS